jgi:hypothetical protein
MTKRSLVDITLEEAVEVLKLGEGFYEGIPYQLRINPLNRFPDKDRKFAQLYHVYKQEETIDVNFSDTKNAVHLCRGNEYYRTHYRIVKYLEKQGFDLEAANERD